MRVHQRDKQRARPKGKLLEACSCENYYDCSEDHYLNRHSVGKGTLIEVLEETQHEGDQDVSDSVDKNEKVQY